MLTHSEQINEIGAALAKAQGEIEGASKSSVNPHFKSKYADLASVWDVIRAPLSKNGIAIIQSPSTDGLHVSVETLMLHGASGQWFRSVLVAVGKDESPQTAGSCITYLRRYALQSLTGVAPEDDDANAAQGHGNGKVPHPADPPQKPDGYDKWLADFIAVSDNGRDALNAAFKESPQALRTHLVNVDKVTYESLRTRAQNADARNAALAKEKVA
jgi:hypothetical protein